MEISLSHLHSHVLPSFHGALITKIMGRTEIKLLELMFLSRFPTVGVFQAKKGRKENFLEKKEIFLEKKGIFSVESSISGFTRPLGCLDHQNDGLYGNEAFGSLVSR